MIETITPILRVDDLARSRRFYCEVLSFKLDWDAGDMIGVSRDQRGLMLCQGGQGQKGTWVWVGVEDASALHAELAAKGAPVQMALTNFPWAYEFRVGDPDGHVLRFGSESRADMPVESVD